MLNGKWVLSMKKLLMILVLFLMLCVHCLPAVQAEEGPVPSEETEEVLPTETETTEMPPAAAETDSSEETEPNEKEELTEAPQETTDAPSETESTEEAETPTEVQPAEETDKETPAAEEVPEEETVPVSTELSEEILPAETEGPEVSEDPEASEETEVLELQESTEEAVEEEALLETSLLAASNGPSANDRQMILDGTMQLTYGMFGAVGDGKTNDYSAIRAAHEYANELYLSTGTMVTVYGEPGKTYYISTTPGVTSEGKTPIDIVTNVDWRGASFILDDFVDNDGDGTNDVFYKQPVFDVVPDMKADSTGSWAICISFDNTEKTGDQANDKKASALGPITPSTTNVKPIIDAVKASYYYRNLNFKNSRHQYFKNEFDNCRIWGAFIEDSSKRWFRKGSGESGGNPTGEIITFDSETGELLTGVDFTYNDLDTVRVFPIRNNGISIGNGSFLTRTNNQVYTSSSRSSTTYRGIRVRYTGNVTLHNITHTLDENTHKNSNSYQSNAMGNYYAAFIALQTDAYIKLDSIDLAAHTPVLRYKSDVYNGTYDLGVQNVAYLYMDRLGYGSTYSNDITNNDRWGMLGTNQTKAVFLENSIINRMDAHRGITDLYIRDTVLGCKGLTVDGQGKFLAENVVFDQAYQPISLRQDYGAAWNGDMYFQGISFFLPTDGAYLIYANNTQNWDFGYRSYFPNMYLNDVYISSSNKAPATLLWLADTKTKDSSKANNLYYFKGSLQISDVTTRDLGSFRLFDFYFPRETVNLQKSSYGGDNQVTLDLDSKVAVNADLSVSNPKFKLGSASGNPSGTRRYLQALYSKGLSVINGSYEPIPVSAINLNVSSLTLKEGEQSLLKMTLSPRCADKRISYSSSNSSVVSVDSVGHIQANGPGQAVITVTAPNGKQTSCTVTVTEVPKPSNPKLVAIYNSASGADIRFKAVEGYTDYTIMRKEGGVWKEVKTVSLNSLKQEGGGYKYIDTEVKGNYGKGYIYSVALKDEDGNVYYDRTGLALYRLDKPVITSAVRTSDTEVTVSWTKLDAKGYELQYTTDGGKNWYLGGSTEKTSFAIGGLKKNDEVTFRLRCYKDNANRGRTYSQYSDWVKAGSEVLKKPTLVAIYNSAGGADIRWKPMTGVNEYTIMKKTNGKWAEVVTVKASSLTKDGGNYKYIDTSVKGNYGRGYIYSVAIKDSKGNLLYDTYGLPLYRLRQPSITSITSSSGKVTLNWTATECQGHEVQYSADNGKSWQKAEEVKDGKQTSQTLSGLKKGTTYVFRIRCQKTNKDRGRTWSQYSEWKKCTVK